MIAADPRGLLALLAKDDLLRVVAALALEIGEPDEVARVTNLPGARLRRALDTLASAGLATATEGRWSLERERFAQALRTSSARPEPPSDVPRTLRPFFAGRRLREIPAQHSKRLTLLRYLVERFEPGREYREADVNRILNDVHEDHAALRRYLVDEGLLSRGAGLYHRT